MLALSFFTVVFSSLLWIIYALMHVMDKLGGGAVANAGILDISIYLAFVLLPVFAIWVVFAIISSYLHNQSYNRNLLFLLAQMKKNQDYSDLLARVMLEGEQQLKDGFVIQQFDLFISDMNELISEIIQRSSLASSEQIDHLWSKVRNGGKWAFGKVVIEVNHNQQDFQLRLYEKARNDKVLAGTVMEFCARYLGITDLLEKHDHEKIFLGIVETGVLGKVYSIFSPIADEIRRNRSAASKLTPNKEFVPAQTAAPQTIKKASPAANSVFEGKSLDPADRPQVSVIEKATPKTDKFNLIEKLGLFKKRKDYPTINEPEINPERDPFSMALERSFGNAEPTTETAFHLEVQTAELSISQDEPQFHIALPESEKVTEVFAAPANEIEPHFAAMPPEPKKEPEDMSNTRRTLDNLRKEWENMKRDEAPSITEEPSFEESQTIEKQSASQPDADEDNVAYPFGGWVNEDNYHK